MRVILYTDTNYAETDTAEAVEQEDDEQQQQHGHGWQQDNARRRLFTAHVQLPRAGETAADAAMEEEQGE